MPGPGVRGCFVTGTDTGVGKTVLAGAIVAAVRARGLGVRALKPVLTGLEDAPDPAWPHDHELLARAAGCSPEDVVLRGYDPAVSPHLAVQLAERELDMAAVVQEVLRISDQAAGSLLVVEGVGGLRVPLADGWDVCRLAGQIGLPLIIAGRPGLGTINHTLMTLELARAAGLTVAGVVLTPWPDQPDRIQRSNRETIAALGGVSVAGLPPVARGSFELLALAGAALPLDEWLGLDGR